MAYYVTCILAGVLEEEGRCDTLEAAKVKRAEWDAEAIKDGHEPGFWIICDENGKEVDWK